MRWYGLLWTGLELLLCPPKALSYSLLLRTQFTYQKIFERWWVRREETEGMENKEYNNNSSIILCTSIKSPWHELYDKNIYNVYFFAMWNKNRSILDYFQYPTDEKNMSPKTKIAWIEHIMILILSSWLNFLCIHYLLFNRSERLSDIPNFQGYSVVNVQVGFSTAVIFYHLLMKCIKTWLESTYKNPERIISTATRVLLVWGKFLIISSTG